MRCVKQFQKNSLRLTDAHIYNTQISLNKLKNEKIMERNNIGNRKSVFENALSYMPCELKQKINDYFERAHISESRINEIRLRSGGPCALVVAGKNVSLGMTIGREEIKDVFKKICGGAIFAHRDDVCRGFITLDSGIRVGVCGYARYEHGAVVGIGDISSLVFRIPTGECSFGRELYRRWVSFGCGGMLICSGAGEGKTTAIRALAGFIGSGDDARRVVVADERCEFNAADYKNSHVDVLKGYKRSLGVDIAIRTMSAEVLIVDEISSEEDSKAMLASLGAGVTVIATVHARSLSDAMQREYVRELICGGLFDLVCTVSRREGRFSFSVERIDAEGGCLAETRAFTEKNNTVLGVV